LIVEARVIGIEVSGCGWFQRRSARSYFLLVIPLFIGVAFNLAIDTDFRALNALIIILR
jgi:hypothetical protein